MMKVLIAEDEMLVRIGLKNSIDWEKLGMKVIADVANGQAAWDIYITDKPDLILTDIRMPVMDGMELIARIREQDHETKFIILTVYEEFDLVRKSLHLGVTDYILKLNMSIEEMENVLAKIGNEWRSSQDKQAKHGRLTDSASQTDAPDPHSDMLHVKESAVKDFLFYGRYTESEFAALAVRIPLRLQPERIVLCVMAFDRFAEMERKFKDNHGKLIRFSLLNIITELLDGYGRGEVIHEKDEKYLLMIGFPDIVGEGQLYARLQEILAHVQSVIKKYLNASVTFGISTLDNGYAAMKRQHRECAAALEQRYALGGDRYIRWEIAGADTVKSAVEQKLEQAAAAAESFHERYQKEMQKGIRALAQSGTWTRTEVEQLFVRWIHWPTVNASFYAEDLSAKALDYVEQIHACGTLDETLAIFRRYLADVRSAHANRKAMSKEIAEAVDYIRQHYAEEISLQQLADHVRLNASYLTSLFKKELQLTFVDYLNHYRIDMAKELLVGTHLKSYQIAEQVGYLDDSYFSRIFKKITSMRPNEFRKRWFVENGEERHDADDGSLG